MSRHGFTVVSHHGESVMATNKVLRNTYLLLGMTFLFSALMAYLAVVFQVSPVHPILFIAGAYGLMFLTSATQNSPMGILSVFAFTGFMGYTLGPILTMYMSTFSNGGQIIATSLGATGLIFFALSGYVLTTKKDFNYLGGFLFVGSMVAILGMIASIFFQIPALSLMVSAVFILISSGYILFSTSQIIQGGETNYIAATVTLYVSIYNLFLSLLNILGALGGERD
jgi:modulator of FtsH protease